MLTEQEKNHILIEETYRHEIRRELEGNKNGSNGVKVWAIFNSAFFLWFLSTIIIGLVSFSYASWESKKEKQRKEVEQLALVKRENQLTQRKIDNEIANRLNYVYGVLYEDGIVPDPINEALIALEKPAVGNYPVSIFPEYAGRSLHSLLWELLQILPEDTKEDERQKIKRAYQISQQFPLYYVIKTQNASSKNMLPNRSNLYALFADDFNLERWGSPFRQVKVEVKQEGTLTPNVKSSP